MLDRNYLQDLNDALNRIPCRVVIPSEWGDFFSQRGPQSGGTGRQRRFGRMNYRTKILIELGTSLPAIQRKPGKQVVLMRDISRKGAGFLHAEQLYPGELVRLSLATGPMMAQVTRCIRHNPHCYEVGAEFYDPLLGAERPAGGTQRAGDC